MRLEDSRVLVGIMLAIIISSTTLSILVENQNDEKFSNPIPDEQNLNFTSQKSNATLTLTDIDSPNIIDIFVGGYNSCFINSDYEFYCWGEGDDSQLGANQGSDTHFPVLINFGADYVVKHSSWSAHACAISGTGSVFCWGDAHHGRLGNGATTGDFGPTLLDLGMGRTATEISVGGTHSCALLDNNYVSCWGLGSQGRNGQGFHSDYIIDEPENITVIPSGLNVTNISAGNAHTCAILTDNSVICWGMHKASEVRREKGIILAIKLPSQ